MRRILPLLLLLLAACVRVPTQDAPVKKYFLLEPARPAASAPATSPTPVFDAALVVRDTRVAPPYGGRPLVYKTAANRFETDYYNLLLSPPDELLSQATRQWLGQAGVFPYVVLPGSDARRGYVLETLVTDLYADFAQDKALAVVGLQAFLQREEPAGRKVVFHQDYRREVPLGDRTPEAVVAGYNQGLAEILTQLCADMAAQAPQAQPAARPQGK